MTSQIIGAAITGLGAIVIIPFSKKIRAATCVSIASIAVGAGWAVAGALVAGPLLAVAGGIGLVLSLLNK